MSLERQWVRNAPLLVVSGRLLQGFSAGAELGSAGVPLACSAWRGPGPLMKNLVKGQRKRNGCGN